MGIRIKIPFKKIIKYGLIVSGGLILCLFMIFFLFRTETGMQYMARMVEKSLNAGQGIQVKIGRVTGSFPFSLQCADISIADTGGKWLSLNDIAFEWQPLSLIKKSVDIKLMRVREVRLIRRPNASVNEEAGGEPESFVFPDIPIILIEQLKCDHFYLGKPLFGVEAVFSVDGHITADPDIKGLEGALMIERTDKPDSFLEIKGSVRGGKPFLTLDIKARESDEVLVKNLLGLSETGPVSIRLTGEGPINEWNGQLVAEAEKLARVESTVRLSIREGVRLKGEGMINVRENRIPEPLLPVIGTNPVRFNLDMETDGKKHLKLNHFVAGTDNKELRIQGRFDLDNAHMEALLGLDIGDLSSFNVLTGGTMGGKLSLKCELTGPFNRPGGTFSLSIADPFFADAKAKGITAEIILEAGNLSPNPFQSVQIKGKGSVDDLAIRGLTSPFPFKRFEWSIDADLEKGKPISVKRCEVTAENLSLGFSGMISPLAQSADGDVKLIIKDLGMLSGITGTELTGRTDMKARVRGDLVSGNIRAEIEGHGSGLTFLPPVILSMIEPGISFKSSVHLDRGEQLKIEGLSIRSSSGEITGAGSIDLSTLNIGVDSRLVIPGLSVLSKHIGKGVAGTLTADVKIEGAFRNPKIRADAVVKEMDFEGISFRKAHITTHAENVFDNPEGDFKLDLDKGGHEIGAGGSFILEYPDLLLKGLSLTLPETVLTGDIETDLGTGIIKGSIKGRSGDLASLSLLLGEPINGRAEMDILFMEGQKGQDLMLKLHGNQLESRVANVDELTLDAEIRDVFNSMEGKAALESKSIQRSDLRLESLGIEIEGGLKDAGFRLEGVGISPQKFNLKTSGNCIFSGSDLDLNLVSLQGNYGGYPVSLKRPLSIRKISKNLELEDLDLALEDGSLMASGKIEGESILFDGRIEGIHLETFRRFGFPDLKGTVTAEASISGTLNKPAGHVQVSIGGIGSKDFTLQNLPEGDLMVKMNLDNDRLSGDVLLSGLSEKPFTAVLEIPAEISFLPMTFSLGNGGEIKGEVWAGMGIKHFPSFFELEDHIMAGDLSVELTLKGKLENPDIKGHVSLSGGYYENAAAGILIKDININISVKGDQLILEMGNAKDSANGIIQAKGRILFHPGEEFPFLLDLISKDAKVIGRDDITITTDGTLNLSGNLSGGTLSGSLDVKGAEIIIPDHLPSDVKDMDVTEINLPIEKQPIKPKIPKKSIYSLNLDVAIDAPGKIFIRGRGLDSEWKSKLNISGTAATPLINGDLRVIRGKYTLFGKPFSLSKGVIAFNGLNPPVPDIDVTAEYKRSDMTTRVGVSSSQSDLKIIMESDPQLPQDEILSRLLFGRSMAKITPIQALQLAQALNTLRGGGGGILKFFDRTRNFLGVDQLEVKQAGENIGQTSVSVGKYIGESIYLEVEKGLGADSGKVSVEVDLTPNITVESEVGTDTQGGVGINWKWDY